MALSFPPSPTVGQEYTSGSRTWVWDGTAWVIKADDIADDIDSINAELATKVSKTGDLMTGNLNISRDYPMVQFTGAVGTLRFSDEAGLATYDVSGGGWGPGTFALMGQPARPGSAAETRTILLVQPTNAVEFLDAPSLKVPSGKITSLNFREGNGSPEGVVTAPVGTKYIDLLATNGAIEWIKATGAGATGWRVTFGDTGWRNISTFMLDPWLSGTWWAYIRRVGDVAFLQASANSSAGATTSKLFDIPAGFRPNGAGFMYTGNLGLNYIPAHGGSVHIGPLGNGHSLYPAVAAANARWVITWPVMDAGPWPVTLPGTAA
jgi:hypothetical protein